MSDLGAAPRRLNVFLVAGESSGDALGAGLLRALVSMRAGAVTFRGVGGPRMAEAGLTSIFPMRDLMAVGIGPVIAKLPTILRRLSETVAAIVAAPPDVLILIDLPDFNQRIADRVRRRLPRLPIVKYVSPTVWAWRAGRARAMCRSIDLVLALLPFEPQVLRDLAGPPCVYVGHPLLGDLHLLRSSEPAASEPVRPPLVLALPGSRRQEIRRLGGLFGEVLQTVALGREHFEVVLPTLPHLLDEVAAMTAGWSIRPRIVTGDADKYAAFRRARAALAASGTVTLELALAGIPHVAAYRVSAIESLIFQSLVRVHPVIQAHSVILANLVLGEFVVPEFLQSRCTVENLVPALAELIDDTSARRRQIEAFKRLDAILDVGGIAPSERAARAVVELLERR